MLIYGIRVYITMEATTVKVSKETLRELVALQRSSGASSLEETIRRLVKQHRKDVLSKNFGLDKKRVRRFQEGDRGEDRS